MFILRSLARLAWFIVLAEALFLSVAYAEIVRFRATLDASAQVPPNASTGSGEGEFFFDLSTYQLTYTVVFQGLTGPAVAAHIHGPADSAINAPIVVSFPVPRSPINGTVILPEALAAALAQGRLYVNIHTEAHPAGEIRGQIVR